MNNYERHAREALRGPAQAQEQRRLYMNQPWYIRFG